MVVLRRPVQARETAQRPRPAQGRVLRARPLPAGRARLGGGLRSILPERAAARASCPATGWWTSRPRSRSAAYLALVDRYPTSRPLASESCGSRRYEYGQIAPRLTGDRGRADAFQENYTAELALVGRETRKDRGAAARRQRDGRGGAAALGGPARPGPGVGGRRHSLRQGEGGRARRPGLDAGAGLPEAATRQSACPGLCPRGPQDIAEAYPAQVERARRRAPSLRTRLDAIETRSAGIAPTSVPCAASSAPATGRTSRAATRWSPTWSR